MMETIIKFCGGCVDGMEVSSENPPLPDGPLCNVDSILRMTSGGQVGKRFMMMSPAAFTELTKRRGRSLDGNGAGWQYYEVTSNRTDGDSQTIILSSVAAPKP